MNDGMKILIERMKTNPEEFKKDKNPFATDSKWTQLVHKYEHNLPQEDLRAFKEAIDTIRQEEFTAEVMAELLNPKSEEQLTLNPYSNSNLKANVGSVTLGTTNSGAGTRTNWGTSAISTLRQQELDLQYQELLSKAVLDRNYIQPGQVYEIPEEPKPKTLFGKLFNYT